MAYDRYENRRDRDWRGSSDYERGRRDERGFFERAGDEIASWFGDDDAERRRREDDRMNRGSGWSRDRDFDRDRSGSRPMNWTSSDRDYRSGMSGYAGYDRGLSSRGGFGSDRETDRSYRPLAGDYGRSDSPWGRDDYRRTSFAGSNRDNDRHYHSWRQRQLDDLDRDYDQYCRERQDRFESDFGTWREGRMSKRQQLASIREHMDVVGSDGETIGKVDCVKGDRIVLTRSDSDDNRHHAIDCSMIQSIEGDQVRLDVPAEEAKSRFKGSRGRSFFGRRDEDDRDLPRDRGGTNLERSFSGTYDEEE